MDLTGALVRLRAPRPEDAEPMVGILADPDVVAGLTGWAWGPYGLEDAQRFIDGQREDAVQWAIEDRADGAFAGMTGLVDIDDRCRHCWWEIWIGPPSRWRRGLGSEACAMVTRFAFDHLGMEKVCLRVYESSAGARRIYERAGYQLEGSLPRDSMVDGRLITLHIMSAFRDHPLYAR
jgi:RimJ/RimL family protein N-acetyltransferase